MSTSHRHRWQPGPVIAGSIGCCYRWSRCSCGKRRVETTLGTGAALVVKARRYVEAKK